MGTIVLNYDKNTGQLKDGDGLVVLELISLVSVEDIARPLSVQDLVDLRAGGFDVEEISAMRRKGIV